MSLLNSEQTTQGAGCWKGRNIVFGKTKVVFSGSEELVSDFNISYNYND